MVPAWYGSSHPAGEFAGSDAAAGARRVLTADAFLAAALLTPMLGLDMHLTMLTATIRGWSPSQRRDVGLDPGTEVTYKMVCDAFHRLCRACDDARGPLWDSGTVAQALLTASLQGQPLSGSVAVDGTDVTTWAKFLYSNPVVDADPDAPPPPDSPAAPQDPARPHTSDGRRADTPLGPDDRCIYSLDVDARIDWRSPKFGESEYYLGFEAHVVTDVPGTNGDQVPHVARAPHLVPAGSHRGAAGLVAVERAGDLPAPREVLCDRAYNYTRPATFSRPLLGQGCTLIVDLHPNQRGVHPGQVPGTMWIDGTLYTTCIPPGLVEITPITRDMTCEEREHAQQQRRQRQPYAPRIQLGKLFDLRCPRSVWGECVADRWTAVASLRLVVSQLVPPGRAPYADSPGSTMLRAWLQPLGTHLLHELPHRPTRIPS